MDIRHFQPDYLSAVAKLYAHYVNNSAITFDLEAPSAAQMGAKLDGLSSDGYPVLVVLDDHQRLLGFAYASTYRPKRAYQHTAEITIYVDPEAQGKGIGSALMDALLTALENDPKFHLAIAMIADDAKASIKLHKKLGFRTVGYLEEVGQKFGQWHGVSILQRQLSCSH